HDVVHGEPRPRNLRPPPHVDDLCVHGLLHARRPGPHRPCHYTPPSPVAERWFPAYSGAHSPAVPVAPGDRAMRSAVRFCLLALTCLLAGADRTPADDLPKLKFNEVRQVAPGV